LRVSALRSDLINPSIALHHDRILKRTGDGMREHLNGSKAADSGPSRGDCCRPAIRPIEAFKVAVGYDRFTSLPAGMRD
jgi:hypothetical protein